MANLLSLPDVDVVYDHIFMYLTLKDLANLHEATSNIQSLITVYIGSYCKFISYDGMHSIENLLQYKIEQRTDIKGFSFKGCKWLKDEDVMPLLANNKQLSYLNFDSCVLITDETLLKISMLSNLEYLDLSLCKPDINLWARDVSAQGLKKIATNLRKLKYSIFDIFLDVLDDENIKLLAMNNKDLVCLKSICITPNVLKDIGSNLSHLKEFRCSFFRDRLCSDDGNIDLFDESIMFLTKNNKKLEVLCLSCLDLASSNGFYHIGKNLCHLKKLSLEQCQNLNDENIKIIVRNNKNLSHLYLSGLHSITEKAYLCIAENLHNLAKLGMKYCHYFNDESLKHIIASNENLKHLQLIGIDSITSFGFSFIGENLCHLKKIHIEDCSQVNDDNIETILENNNGLSDICIKGCDLLTQNIFLKSGRNLEKLKKFHVDNINDEILKHITANNKYIESLELGRCYSITNNGVRFISENLSRLTNLSLDEGVTIDDEHVKCIAISNQKLKRLDLTDCHEISDECQLDLKNLLPDCYIESGRTHRYDEWDSD